MTLEVEKVIAVLEECEFCVDPSVCVLASERPGKHKRPPRQSRRQPLFANTDSDILDSRHLTGLVQELPFNTCWSPSKTLYGIVSMSLHSFRA